MTTTVAVRHPASVTAILKGAEAHERAAAILTLRQPSVAKQHADAARALRARVSTG